MTPIHIATIPKNRSHELRITIDSHDGRPVANLRVWFRAAGGWRPGGSGMAFKIALLPAVADALAKAEREARELGLLDVSASGGAS